MQQRLRVGGDIFEDAPHVNADIFYMVKKDALSEISGYVWTRPDWRYSLYCFFVLIRKFYKVYQNIIQFRFCLRIAKKLITCYEKCLRSSQFKCFGLGNLGVIIAVTQNDAVKDMVSNGTKNIIK